MKIYIAGPVTGKPDKNRPAFHLMATRLEKAGFTCLYTAQLSEGLSEADYMKCAHAFIEICDAVVLLNGWKDSDGALAEFTWARKLDKGIYYQDNLGDLLIKGENVINEAKGIVAEFTSGIGSIFRPKKVQTASIEEVRMALERGEVLGGCSIENSIEAHVHER